MVMVLGSTVAGSWGSICGVASLALDNSTWYRRLAHQLSQLAKCRAGLARHAGHAVGPAQTEQHDGRQSDGASWALAGV